DSGAFVSNKYLSDTEPVQQVAGVTATDQTVPSDLVTELGVTTNTPYVANATDFFNYMNQQRSANGLGMLTWDDGMAAVAQRRAKELATDYSHNGNVEMYGENIHNNTNGSYIDWYDSFYNSPAHRETMMTANYGRGAAAVYFDGYKYYVVCNFAGTPLSTEQLIELGKPENLVPAGGNESGTTQGFSTTGETLDPNNPDDAEIIKNLDELDRLADEGLIDVPEL
ncbi:MAG: CAP domain-containing protein, partial [Acetatifactor sp.]|nr:CAP domain-containing protein [Acetatifactor sp.]